MFELHLRAQPALTCVKDCIFRVLGCLIFCGISDETFARTSCEPYIGWSDTVSLAVRKAEKVSTRFIVATSTTSKEEEAPSTRAHSLVGKDLYTSLLLYSERDTLSK